MPRGVYIRIKPVTEETRQRGLSKLLSFLMPSKRNWRVEILVDSLPRRLNAIVLGPMVIYRAGWKSPKLEDWVKGQLLAVSR